MPSSSEAELQSWNSVCTIWCLPFIIILQKIHYSFPIKYWFICLFLPPFLVWCLCLNYYESLAIEEKKGVIQWRITAWEGAECPQTLLTGKFLLTYRERSGKEKKWKWRRKKKENRKMEGGKLKMEGGKVTNKMRRWEVFFFLFCFFLFTFFFRSSSSSFFFVCFCFL